jgi:hypothetical protein
MDQRLKKALEMSNYVATLNNQKQLAYDKFQESLVLYHSGSQITITPSLIAFCTSLVASGTVETIIVDDNNSPVAITELGDFAEKILEIYNSSTKEFLETSNNLKKQRSVEKLIEYEQ